MRLFFRLSLVSALLLSCCQPREPASSALSVTGRGGELRVLIPGDPRGFDPNMPGDEIAQVLAPSLYSALVTLDTDGRLLPDLAESWEVKDGGRTYLFHLRKGILWHDGRPFGSGDVRFTLERLKSEESISHEAVSRITRIETPDNGTVELHLREPWAPFLSTLAWGGTYILPRHRSSVGTNPVGTGPFQFGEHVLGKRIVLEASPRFHRPGPFLDRVTFLVTQESSVAAERLLHGEADHTVTRIPLDLVPRLERDPGLRVLTGPSNARIFCAFNLRRPPLGDIRVREAINRAIDRGDLVRKALFGYGAPGFGFYTPSVAWAYNGDAHVPPLDRKRAQALLAEAGARRELDLVVPSLAPVDEIGELLRDQLAEIGLAVRVTALPLNEWSDRVIRRKDFDLTLMSGRHGPDPENLSFRFGSRTANPNLGYANPELDAALAAGAATVDLEQRARSYYRAQEILARDLPIAPLAEAVTVTVFRSNVRGLPNAEGRGLVSSYDFSLVRVRP
ncbi:MAG TPA: ABC transporter substrate-binding protein [Thermoanaerobaculia bacterium]|jgi:peptide/nickel transport system substrate-binding protein|nr:ABC transporter substrate-binding protein [Thermoanaerobaculia bacterium]